MPLERILIVGNDDIAWLAADLLSRAVRPPFIAVQLIRPTEPVSPWATLARGATISPEAAAIWDAAGADELDLLRRARGNFTVGTVLQGWAAHGAGFLPFGSIGDPAAQIAIQHVVARHTRDQAALPLTAFMGGALSARAQRFAPPRAADASAQAAFDYGLHVDGALQAAASAASAVARGTEVVEAGIAFVSRDDAGLIASVTLDDGTMVTADLFVDCGNWLDDEPAVIDWSAWLPCNRLACMTRDVATAPSVSATLAAHASGWQRQASLRGAVIDSFAYCDAAPGDRPADAVAYRPGRAASPWRANCVSIGDGAVILDPIGDMRQNLAVSAIARLAASLPGDRASTVEAREYNRRTVAELDDARDFAIAHYRLNGRVGDPFWDQCRTTVAPDTLQARIELYRDCGRVAAVDDEAHGAPAWIALFDALGWRPLQYDSLADLLAPDEVDRQLRGIRDHLVAHVAAMPPYAETARIIGQG